MNKYIFLYMSAERNDQTKKVNNRFRPPETNISFRQGRLGATKNVFWPKLGSQPTDFRFDRWKMFRAACRTRSGGRKYPNRPKTALFTPICFLIRPFFPPLICYSYYLPWSLDLFGRDGPRRCGVGARISPSGH